MTQPNQFSSGEAVDKAKEYVRDHPEQADAAFD